MRRSEIQPLPTASWIGWCIRLTGSSCKENRCAKSEAAKTEKNEKRKRAVEMAGLWKAWKTKKQVSRFPTAFSYMKETTNRKRAGFALRPPRRRFAPSRVRV